MKSEKPDRAEKGEGEKKASSDDKSEKGKKDYKINRMSAPALSD
jgi:hypothetical protein